MAVSGDDEKLKSTSRRDFSKVLIMKRNLRLGILFLSLFLAFFPFIRGNFALDSSNPGTGALNPIQATDYLSLQDTVNMAVIESHVRFLSEIMYTSHNILPSRATGTPGNLLAAQYVYGEFLEYGLQNVSYHNFTVVMPVSYGANITLIDKSNPIPLYPVLPNLVCTSTTPTEGITGNLIYAGSGRLVDFDGKKVEGSIVLLDWESGDRWLNALRLGAKAVIFLSPKEPDSQVISWYGTTEEAGGFEKYLPEEPIQLPRFLIKEEDAVNLLAHLGETVTVRSTVVWEEVPTQNVVGYVEGENPDVTFLLMSYYDSYSLAPDLAPGAQEACGIAALLELARYFSEHKPKMTIKFIAHGGHHQMLAGALHEVNNYYAWWLSEPSLGRTNPERAAEADQTWFFLNLDFSTGNDGSYVTLLSPTYSFFVWDRELRWLEISNYLENIGDEVNAVREVAGLKPHTIYLDKIGGWGGYVDPLVEGFAEYDQAIPMKVSQFDSAIYNKHRTPIGYTVTTPRDMRQFYRTPYDTLSRVDFKNLEPQLRFAHALILTFFDQNPDALITGNGPLTNFNPRTIKTDGQQERRYGSWYQGTIGQWSAEKGWYEPVPNALVTFKAEQGFLRWSSLVLTDRRFVFADEYGRFEFVGAYDSYICYFNVDGWVLNSTTGDILMAPDRGTHRYHREYPLYDPVKELGWTTVYSLSSSVVLTDRINPETLTAKVTEGMPLRVNILEFKTNAPLDHYSNFESDFGNVFFLPSNARVIFTLTRLMGRYPVAFLINATQSNPSGSGYNMESGQTVFTLPILRYADNLRWLTSSRLSILGKYKQHEPELLDKFSHATSLIDHAYEALQPPRYEYSKAEEYATEALKELFEIYVSQRTEIEETTAIAPYLALFLVPFTFLAERLLFRASGTKRIFTTIGIFAALLVTLSLVHPSFELSVSPYMIILGVANLILLSPIVLVIFGDVISLMSAIQVRLLGRHSTEISRAGEIVNAFFIGIENLRRRKLRSGLVLVSMILMVSSLVAFTSIAPFTTTKFNNYPTGFPLYQGFLIRWALWGEGDFGLGEDAVRFIASKYPNMAPRAWSYSLWGKNDESLHSDYKSTGYRITYGDKYITAHTLLGFTPQEPLVTGLGGKALPTIIGRWFKEGDTNTIILNTRQAEALNITRPSIVQLQGTPFQVIGIINYTDITFFVDVDGEWITPIDQTIPPEYNSWDIHMDPDESFIIPYQTVIDLYGGETASVAVRVDDADAVLDLAHEAFTMLSGFTYFASTGEAVWTTSQAYAFTIMGMEFQVVPLVLILLSLINTVLASVHQRKGEIMIYSTLGLSPSSIAFMFIGETIIYAVMGSILGFIGGTFLMRSLAAWNPIPINLTSQNFNISVGLSVFVAFLASAYPSLLAAKLVTPSMERAWKISTEPIKDEWEVPLPFTLTTEREVNGFTAYIHEFMQTHLGLDALIFSAANIRIEQGQLEENPYKAVKSSIRLFPYELGILQETAILAVQQVAKRWEFRVFIERKSGLREIWIESNRDFIDQIRKQFLLWNSFSLKEREHYYDMFRRILKRKVDYSFGKKNNL